MNHKTVSRAAKLRHQAELDAAAAEPSKMPAAVVAYVNDWVPQDRETNEHWGLTGPVCRAIMLGSNKTSRDATAKCITAVALFVDFCRSRDIELSASSVMKTEHINEWFRVGLDPDKRSLKTRQDYRSRLRGLAMSYDQSGVEAKTVVGEYAKVQRPYTERELAEIWQNVSVQPNQRAGAMLRVAFLLGAGVGANAADMREVTHSDVDDRGDDGVWVTLSGKAPSGKRKTRTVPLLRRFEDDFRVALCDLPTGRGRLLPGNESRREVTSALVKRAFFAEGSLAPSQGRLRSTWLAIQVVQPVPFLDLMHASGLGSSRSLTDIVSYLDTNEVCPAYLREAK